MTIGLTRNPKLCVILLLSSALAACATLPSSGPTSNVVSNGSRDGLYSQYVVKQIAGDTLTLLQERGAASNFESLGDLAEDRLRVDELAPGDRLEIRIFEIGQSLFSGSEGGRDTAPLIDNNTAHEKVFSNIVLDDKGGISLPYIGKIFLSGLSRRLAETQIEHALLGKSQNPQVVITLLDSMRSSVTIMGNVRKPGRVVLTPGNERLLDGIIAAGGASEQPYDIMIRMTRQGQVRTRRLSEVSAGDARSNILLSPGDQIEVLKAPLTFLAMGATDRVSQIPFDSNALTLAEALAKMGGPSDSRADPRAIFLFRLPDVDKIDNPLTLFRLDLMQPQSYYLAQQVYLRDKDLIYIANSRANLPTKFVSILNQFFSPVVTARALSK